MDRDEFQKNVQANPKYKSVFAKYVAFADEFEKVSKNEEFNLMLAEMNRSNCSWPFYKMACLKFLEDAFDRVIGERRGDTFQPSKAIEIIVELQSYKNKYKEACKLLKKISEQELPGEFKKIISDYKSVDTIMKNRSEVNTFLNIHSF